MPKKAKKPVKKNKKEGTREKRIISIKKIPPRIKKVEAEKEGTSRPTFARGQSFPWLWSMEARNVCYKTLTQSQTEFRRVLLCCCCLKSLRSTTNNTGMLCAMVAI